ncbi:MAG TPA: SAM-dependent methyltransferase [Patescibacteria group bacterium]|nr:SAM-dependent methyltransferase [Patescibacteria group bacterium]
MLEQFVSRAGKKLEHAFNTFPIDVAGAVCADFGCSTGGFVDCLLQHDAAKVYAIDTGYGVLDWKLRNHERVVVMERTNALRVKLPEQMDFISIDTSWTRQKNIIPHALELLKNNGIVITLIKPHYEAEQTQLRSGKLQQEFLPQIIEKVQQELAQLPLEIKGISESPITGKKGGNIEYVLWIQKRLGTVIK